MLTSGGSEGIVGLMSNCSIPRSTPPICPCSLDDLDRHLHSPLLFTKETGGASV